MDKKIIRKKREEGNTLFIRNKGRVTYLTFPALERCEMVSHLFSTRLGGVSEGHLGTLNLSYTRGDKKECVDENFRRIGEILGASTDDFVLSDQTHTANVRVVTEADKGKGIVKARDYTDVDGLVTNVPGVVLSTFFADCVPLYFVDPVKRAIGLSHSGWKGTAAKIGKATVETMQRQYGSNPSDIIAAIGPSICKDCYEVSEDVALQFPKEVRTEKPDGKYLLDLWEANRRILLEAGIESGHISTTDICTCCNPEFLFSHRASHGKRGNLGAFLMIKGQI